MIRSKLNECFIVTISLSNRCQVCATFCTFHWSHAATLSHTNSTSMVAEHSSKSTDFDGHEATATRTLTVARQPICSSQQTMSSCHGVHSVKKQFANLVSQVKAVTQHAVVHQEQVESLMDHAQALTQQVVRQQEESLHQQQALRGLEDKRTADTWRLVDKK